MMLIVDFLQSWSSIEVYYNEPPRKEVVCLSIIFSPRRASSSWIYMIVKGCGDKLDPFELAGEELVKSNFTE